MPIGAQLEDIELQHRVRSLLVSGKLPLNEASGVWAGSGRNEACSICEVPIRRRETAFDLLFRTPQGDIELHMHGRCRGAWEQVSSEKSHLARV